MKARRGFTQHDAWKLAQLSAYQEQERGAKFDGTPREALLSYHETVPGHAPPPRH